MSRRPLLTAKTVLPLSKTLYLSSDPGSYPNTPNFVPSYTNGFAGKWTSPIAAGAIKNIGWKPVPNSPAGANVYFGIWDSSNTLIYYAVDGLSTGTWPDGSRLCGINGGSQVAMNATSTYYCGIYVTGANIQLALSGTDGSSELNQSLVSGFDRRSNPGSLYASGFNKPNTSGGAINAPVFFVVFY